MSTAPRILFDHQIFSYQRHGGASRYFCEVLREFWESQGLPVSLGVAASPNEYLASLPFYSGRRLPPRASGPLGAASFLKTYLENERFTRALLREERHDVVHVTFYDPSIVKRLGNKKLVVTILDMIPERFPDLFDTTSLYGRVVTKRWIDGKRLLCERADSILAISEYTKQDLVALLGVDPSRVTVTHLGNTIAHEAGAATTAVFPDRYLLFVGTRQNYKNFPCFVEAAVPLLREDTQLQLLCVGGGPFSQLEHDLFERFGVSERVIQRSLTDADMAACYARAEAFVFPSKYEGFGIPILEALACGCPTVVADASCFPEVGGDAVLYFDPTNAEALTVQLRRLRSDADLRDNLRAAGRARAALFTWAATAKRTATAYCKLLGEGNMTSESLR